MMETAEPSIIHRPYDDISNSFFKFLMCTSGIVVDAQSEVTGSMPTVQAH